MLDQLLALNSGSKPYLMQTVAQILAHPHREIRVETPLVPLEELSEADTESFAELVMNPGTISPSKAHTPVHFEYEGRDFQFTHIYDTRRQVSFDTYPNQFLRHFLRRYRQALCDAGPEESEDVRSLLRQIDAAISGLAEVSAISQVSAHHNVLQKDPNYRQILLAGIALAKIHRGTP
jgi:predicted component of viral defense system (DUF524 family)